MPTGQGWQLVLPQGQSPRVRAFSIRFEFRAHCIWDESGNLAIGLNTRAAGPAVKRPHTTLPAAKNGCRY